MPPEGLTPEEAAAVEAAEAEAAEVARRAAESGDEEPFDKERAMALITKLRVGEKEGAQAKRELAAAQARLKELEDAAKSEDEKKAERLAALEADAQAWLAEKRDLNLRLAVYGLQGKLGVADADLALAALDKGAVEWGQDGTPTNVEDVLTALLEAKPLLKGTPAAAPPPKTPDINSGGGTGNGKRPPLTADELDIARRMGMKPEEYAAYKGARSLDDLSAAEKAAGATTS